MLIVTAPPEEQPVTVEEAREQCEIDGAEHDAKLARYIRSAVAHVQRSTGLTLALTEYEQRCDSPGRLIALETAPVREVTGVSYLDLDGAEQDFPEGGWSFDRTPEGGVVRLTARVAIACRPGNVRVQFAAGFDRPDQTEGDIAFAFPDDARLAVLMLVAHWFATREGEPAPAGVNDILDGLRVYR